MSGVRVRLSPPHLAGDGAPLDQSNEQLLSPVQKSTALTQWQGGLDEKGPPPSTPEHPCGPRQPLSTLVVTVVRWGFRKSAKPRPAPAAATGTVESEPR